MEVKTCSQHMTPKEKDRVDNRSTREKRNWFKEGDIVKANSRYKELLSKEPDFVGGKIIGFKDPYDWEGITALSQAYIEMPCGCVKFVSTGWLIK